MVLYTNVLILIISSRENYRKETFSFTFYETSAAYENNTDDKNSGHFVRTYYFTFRFTLVLLFRLLYIF